MSSSAPAAVEMRGCDEAGPRKMSHRTKHRKEVKRYHQRQQNKHLREEAKARDAQLFLFETTELVARSAEQTRDNVHDAPVETVLTSSALMTVAQKGAAVASIAAGSQPPRPTSEQHLHQQVQLAPASTTSAAAAVTSAHALTSASPSSWDFEFLLRASPASTSAASSPAECSGVDSCATDAVALSTIEDATACRSLSVLEPLQSPAVVSAVQRGRVALPAAASRDLQISATTASGDRLPPESCAPQHSNARPSANWDRISALPIYSGASSTITKLLNSTHVQRVEGVEAIPMQAPLAPGTDMNRPPRNYLTLDPVHNVHQHAPGFLRNQRVALQHMLASAVMEWKDMQQNALIVSSAEAMRTIFEQVYVPERPLALRVQRIGPTLVIDSRASEPSEVHEMRQQALFGKALYLMKETHGQATVEADETAAGAAGQLALALPERRLSSTAASDVHFGANLHRYSQVLRWRMDATEVLIGIDAPIVMDQRTNTEQLVRMKGKVPVGPADAEQRETLRCWFDAMMANVSQVGTYVHHDGIVQSHQVKKTMDILDSVEARMAAAALSFTSRALQWLVKKCRRDGGTYAVVRDYPLEYVELYELPDLDDSAAFVEETDKYFGCAAAAAFASADRDAAGRVADGEAYIESEVPATTSSGYRIGGPPTASQLNRFNWNFGKTCFNIGQHLFRSGDLSRASDALPLLHRSLRLLLPSCREDLAARETVAELVRMVPALVARKLHADAAQTAAAVASNSAAGCPKNAAASCVAGLCSSPEVYRDALLLCGRFEIPLRHMLVEAGTWEGGQLMRAFFARCLVVCSAAACAVVALSLEAYYCGCHHLRALRMARNEVKAKEGKAALRGVAHREEVMAAISSCTQDLLQVVVEGLVRLEEASELVGPLHSAAAAALAEAPTGTCTTDESISVNGATPVSKEDRSSKEESCPATFPMGSSRGSLTERGSQPSPSATSPAHTSEPSELKKCSRGADMVAVSASCSAVLDPRTQVDITPLRSALCELYGDVAAAAMSDAASGFSIRVLTELGRRMEARLQQRGLKLPTTLVWLTTLKADVVSLSFTALRFYGRIGTHTRRHLVKLALVYYLVGKEHHRTARYTKALEALHRAKSLLHASHKAAEDAVFGAVFGSHGMLQWADVMQLLGDVYRSVVERKLDGALGVAAATLAQPLLVGPLYELPEDADSFFTQALSAYTQGGSDKACRSAKAYTLLLYASVLMERLAVSGVPATHSASQHIAQLIREAEELAPSTFAQEREWQTLRLFTVTSAATQDTALARAVEEILLRTTTATSAAASSSHVRQSLPAAVAGGSDDTADASVAMKESHLADANVAQRGGCRWERLVTLPPWPMLMELQKALVCCAMVEREASQSQSRPREATKVASTEAKYRGLLRWVGRTAGYLTSVLEYCKTRSGELQGAAARHQWQSVLRSWREQEPCLLMHRMVSMIALRLLGAAQALLPSTKQQEARGAVKQIACALDHAATVKAGGAEGHAAAVQRLLRDLNTLLAPFVEW
ncbi:conserved hypothetical protein [Leishmania major strain Friedlin]|uniref:Clu domain-containing protein n=1 Tax=Leishmania major TaxID=5664 RepID=Q4QHA1_LEIMA|nr:conserved hypothetical protein [Leishmania major strain Friedlin]CAG9570099.1 hypothetical_protein_-_conserved [Leishmania major strain Friedlin]CAJ02995.1 conserved hypothetical protein [Leishmania major strain Friedlin]|eukprot:XP_001681447.1 conserved hypothetical protein [Leishmania major strain Friedlin]